MSKLTSQQDAFVDAFIELGDALKAYEAVGYSPDRSNAHKLVQRLATEINNRLQNRMTLKTSTALSVLEEIMTNEDNAPRDRLNAVNSWLDRTKIARASTSSVDITQQQTSSQPTSRKVIRDGMINIVIGEGVYFPAKDPMTPDEEAMSFDYSDRETLEWLKDNSH
tara:strand:- start:450 stop:947 length:498 start_codon:yes stop_codon:yes gene_type:complete